MSRRALVTGSEGFTGRYVCQALANAGWEVWGSGVAADSPSSRYVRLDVLDPSSIKSALSTVQPDVVIHLAAMSFVAENDPNIYYQINLLGTRNLLAELSSMKMAPSHVILASSANVYGRSDQPKLSESCPGKPENDYAVSKFAMEAMSQLFREALNITIVRPFNYTGVGQNERFLAPKIVAHIKRGARSIQLGNLDVERDFSDVRDIANYYVALAETTKKYHVINFCSGKSFSLRTLINLATRPTDYRLQINVKSSLKRENEIPHLCGDRTKLNELVRGRPLFNLEDTINWMMKS